MEINALVTNPVLIFFIVLSIILLAPILLNRLRIPHIIGLIMAGVALGPYGFNILARDSSFEIFGQVGIIYLMFLVGLEIDMNEMKSNRTKGAVFGIYTFLIPMILGTVVSMYTLHLDVPTAMLLGSMYASNTLIAYPIIGRFGINRDRAVTITVTGTIFTVMCALIVLALIVGMYTGENESGPLYLLLYTISYSIAVIVIYPRVTRWFLKQYSDNVSQFVFILSLVFLAAWIAQVIGLEAILGAFFAGLVLNRYVPSVSPLMNRLEFVGNALFIPYFLIGVGMLVNVRALSDINTIYVAVNMSIVAIACKWLAAYAAQKTLKLKAVDRNMMFGLSNAHAAAALATVMIGYEMGVFDNSLLNGTIIMILVTCTVSSIVTERTATKIKTRMIHQEDVDTSRARKFARTLIPVSNPLTASGLVDLALLIRNPKNNNPLIAVHVLTENGSKNDFMSDDALAVAKKTAAASDKRVKAFQRYSINLTTGLSHVIKEHDISDVVIGMHRKANIVDSFIGSKVEDLLKATNKMVMISRCLIPLNTVTRIVVAAPAKAELESGFPQWVIRVANMAQQLGCRVIFNVHNETSPIIRGILHKERYNIRSEYKNMDTWDDFIITANDVLDDDLFIIVSARRSSPSYTSHLDELPTMLANYFSSNNIVMCYPEQFGETPVLTSFSDPLGADMNTSSDIMITLRGWYDKLVLHKQSITQRKQNKN